jgi:SAM-dependent methyltransferase
MRDRDVPSPRELRRQFDDIDVYLFDQLLKGRLTPEQTVLEAGCGSGRNLTYLLRSGFRVFGVDGDGPAIDELRDRAAILAPHLPSDNFRVESVESMSFEDASFDVVLAIAVLHFAADAEHFNGMLSELWRVLKPGGLFFARLASVIGMGLAGDDLAGRRVRSPDGVERFLVDEEMLMSLAGWAVHDDMVRAEGGVMCWTVI